MVRPDRRGGMRGVIRAGTLFGQAEFVVRLARAGEPVDEPVQVLLEALDVLDRELEDGDHALVITILARTALEALAAGDVEAATIALDIDRPRAEKPKVLFARVIEALRVARAGGRAEVDAIRHDIDSMVAGLEEALGLVTGSDADANTLRDARARIVVTEMYRDACDLVAAGDLDGAETQLRRAIRSASASDAQRIGRYRDAAG
jgi:hypothetical protein